MVGGDGQDEQIRSGRNCGAAPTLVVLATPRCDSSMSPCCCRMPSAAPISSQVFLSKVTLGRGRLRPAASGAAALLPKWVIPGILGQGRSRSTAGRLGQCRRGLFLSAEKKRKEAVERRGEMFV